MKKTHKYNVLLFLFSLFLFACNDFIETDIEKETVKLLTPGNNLTTVQLTHTFWWDWIDGVEEYNIQIVEGTFSSAISFVLDSTITANKFTYTLYPGNFQWRVKGLNNGYETMYTTYNLVIDSTLDISSLSVILSTPSDNFITNNDNITFSWNSLLNSDDYLLEVHQTSWSGGIVYGPQVEVNVSHNTTLLEGTYIWGVQGRNSTSNTSTSFSTRTLTIDTTPPNPVVLNLPTDNATLTNIYNSYSWTQGSNIGTALTDVIYFYDDAAGTTLNKSIQLNVGITTVQDSLGIGTYYWAVQSTDEAGNIGGFSSLRKVIIQ